MNIFPLTGYTPVTNKLSQVIAPPYDVVTRDEAKAYAAGKPYHMLHITRSDADLPKQCYAYGHAVYSLAQKNLATLLQSRFIKTLDAAYVVYQLELNGREQTGLMALCSNTAAFIKTHEKTRITKCIDRMKLLEALEHQVSPVLLMHRPIIGLTEHLLRLTRRAPDNVANTPDGCVHRMWIVPSSSLLQDYLDEIPALYMADGHHRLAASQAFGIDRILAAIFSSDSLCVLPYHRVLCLTRSTEAALSLLSQTYAITPCNETVQPQLAHELVFYMAGKHWLLCEKAPRYETVLDTIACARADRFLIQRLLETAHTTDHPGIDYIGGSDAYAQVKNQVDRDPSKAGVFLSPVTMNSIMQLSDRGDIMPPKSTWFEPKLADGLISTPI